MITTLLLLTTAWDINVQPASGTGDGTHFEIDATHPAGRTSIHAVFGLFATAPTNWGGCSWFVNTVANTIQLEADQPTSPLAGILTNGRGGAIANSQCELSNFTLTSDTSGYSIGINVRFKAWNGLTINQWVGVDDGTQPLSWNIENTWRVAQGVASGNAYLGLHLLYLSEYSQVSLWNLYFALTSSTAPSHTQLVFCPALYRSGASSSKAWDNLTQLVQLLRGAGRSVTVAAMLSYHAGNDDLQLASGTDSRADKVYGAAVANLAAFIRNNPQTPVVVIPSLEDQMGSNANFITLARTIAAKLDDYGLSGSLRIRRSIDPSVQTDTDNSWADLKSNCSQIRAGTKFTSVSCQIEYHGPRPSSSASAYSNDGVAVWNDGSGLLYKESTSSIANSSTFTGKPKIKLSDFSAAAADKSPVTLLWRPMFNLWKISTTSKAGYRDYVKPSSTRGRTDSPSALNGDYAIGQYEVQVIGEFFRLAPKR